MIFGKPNVIAIEVGETFEEIDPYQIYIQIRFIILGQFIGNWDDRIPITQAWRNMEDFLSCNEYRRDFTLKNVDSATFFERTFSAYYKCDYRLPPVIPNFRDRYHLSEVGGDSICDLYGIVGAEVAPNKSRVVVKDLQAEQFILDEEIDSGEIEKMGKEFVEWAQKTYNNK